MGIAFSPSKPQYALKKIIMSFKINQNIMENILKNVLFPKGPLNSEHIFRILMFELPDHAKETILHLSLSDEEYTPVKVGD